MTRGRLCVVCGFRLAVYLVAMLAVRHAAEPAIATRLALSVEASAPDFIGPLVAMLFLGILLEVLSGAARWR